jgi:hypothetical protein
MLEIVHPILGRQLFGMYAVGRPAGVVVAAHWRKVVIVDAISDMAARVDLEVL